MHDRKSGRGLAKGDAAGFKFADAVFVLQGQANIVEAAQ